jgi:hypothetical protein
VQGRALCGGRQSCLGGSIGFCVCVCVLSVEWEAYYRPIRPSSDVRFLRHCDACMYCRSTN